MKSTCVVFLSFLFFVMLGACEKDIAMKKEDETHRIVVLKVPESFSLKEYVSQLGDHELLFAKTVGKYFIVAMRTKKNCLIIASIHRESNEVEHTYSVSEFVENQEKGISNIGIHSTEFEVRKPSGEFSMTVSRVNGPIYKPSHKCKKLLIELKSKKRTESISLDW